MKTKRKLSLFRGWFPKDPVMANKQPHIHWKKTRWIALTVVTVLALGFVAYSGAETFLRWNDPQLDVTASYFEKSLNATAVHVGDSVQVTFRVGWHGRVLPEFARDVKIVDPLLASGFVLVDGANVAEYRGGGGSDQYIYTLKVVGDAGVFELPKPQLFLDGAEITLSGVCPSLQVAE